MRSRTVKANANEGKQGDGVLSGGKFHQMYLTPFQIVAALISSSSVADSKLY